jgi:tape measure domain-containing protein
MAGGATVGADGVLINIRTRGGRQAAKETGLAEKGIRQIGRAAEASGRGLDKLGRRMISTPFGFFANQAKYAAYSLEAIGIYAVGAGLKFNASMESNEMAFTHFLGSAQAARSELTTLYNLAKVTPFEFADLTLATRKFLAFGFTVEQSNAMLKTVADTASGLALDQGGIDRMVLAIGQIKSKGTLQAQDLRQLQELGAVDMAKLAKDLGVTREELGDIGKQHISSTKGLRALKKQWDDTFGGMSAKQAKTFSGQLSTLRDNVNQMLGALTGPLFNKLRSRVFPALNDTAESIQRIFNPRSAKYGKLDLSEKIDLSRDRIRQKLGPLWDELGDAIKRLKLGDKLSDAFEAAAPKLMSAAGKLGAAAAKGFFLGWWNAGIYGKLFGLTVLTAWLGGFRALGRLAAAAFRRGWRRRIGKLPTPTGIPPIGPGGGGGGVPTPVPAKKGWLKRAGGWLKRAGGRVVRLGPKFLKWGGPAAVATAAADFFLNPDDAGLPPEEERERFRRASRARTRGAPGPRAHAGRARGDIVIHTHVKVHGREVAKATDRVHADQKARR